MEGWIKLHRKLIDWQWLNKPEMVSLFIYCLIKANHNQNEWQGISIERGQFITSIEKLSSLLGITNQSLRTCLNRLEKTGEINKQTTNKFTIITVCNYDSYQDEKQTTNKQTNKQLTNNQQTTNKQLTTNKNDKNIKNEKNIIYPSLEEVKEYFKEKGYNEEIAIKFYDSYTVANWVDSKGNKVKNWKQKAINVWFREENKIKSSIKYLTYEEILSKGLNTKRKYIWSTIDGNSYAGLMTDDEKKSRNLPIEKIFTIQNHEVL